MNANLTTIETLEPRMHYAAWAATGSPVGGESLLEGEEVLLYPVIPTRKRTLTNLTSSKRFAAAVSRNPFNTTVRIV